MAAVSTTGFFDLTTRFRKYAVSSIVSVPWVMTTPATSGIATISLMRRASFSQTASFMSWEPMLAICSPRRFASFFAWGTAARSWSTPTWPDV